MNRSNFLPFQLASICLLIVACQQPAAPLPGSCRDCNVVLISIDTLRADHLGSYGYTRPTSPFLDSIAAQNILFEKAFVPRGLTRPSIASMLTSLYPVKSGVRNLQQLLSQEIPTIDSILSAHGYQAASFLSGAIEKAGDLHFAQPFDGEDEENVSRAIGWLEKNQSESMFMWLHLLAPHDDYAPPKQYDRFTQADYSGDYQGGRNQLLWVAKNKIKLSEEDHQHIVGLYDGEILYTDALLQRIFEALERLDLLERSIVIVVGDHGEDLYQHQYYFQHMYSIYDSSLHTPLIMKIPGAPKAMRIEQIVESIDIAPTILDLIGLPTPAAFNGRSLVPLIEGNSQEEFDYALSELPTREGFGKILSIRTDRWRYVDNPGDNRPTGFPHHHFYQIEKEELYDLQADPNELTNVVDRYPEVAARLQKQLRAAYGVQTEGKAAGAVDDDTVDRLRELGYVP
jgi:arylsulfatase A-like enzyme